MSGNASQTPTDGSNVIFKSFAFKLLQFGIKIHLTKDYGQIPFPLFLAFLGASGILEGNKPLKIMDVEAQLLKL